MHISLSYERRGHKKPAQVLTYIVDFHDIFVDVKESEGLDDISAKLGKDFA